MESPGIRTYAPHVIRFLIGTRIRASSREAQNKHLKSSAKPEIYALACGRLILKGTNNYLRETKLGWIDQSTLETRGPKSSLPKSANSNRSRSSNCRQFGNDWDFPC